MPTTIDTDRAFMERTLALVRSYKGRYEATNLINCLLGLLLVPSKSMFTGIPAEPLSSLQGWGISPKSIRRYGSNGNGNGKGKGRATTLREIVHHLRNAAAHSTLRPRRVSGRWAGFEFSDPSGFHAVLDTREMRQFVEKLTKHVAVQGHFGPYGSVVGAKYIASWQREPFHRPDCTWVKRINRKNLHGVRSRQEAIKAGHRPCKVCNP